MILKDIFDHIKQEDAKFANLNKKDFLIPKYSPDDHYLKAASSKYFLALLYLRDFVKEVTDYYFRHTVGAKNIDLFMLTSSVSSPMGPGSDSETIKIKFDKLATNLTDSSQFGFEPLLLNEFDKLYCYMPSMRGEDPDERHLNQFFHCEIEIKGELDELKLIAQDYIKIISRSLLQAKNIINLLSTNPSQTKKFLKKSINQNYFLDINFDEAVNILEKSGNKNLISYTKFGRDISANGEIKLLEILEVSTPIWINNFDRDRVPFYQKPLPGKKDKVINADLLFPPIINGSFGGEILGAGQRQDNAEEMEESIVRQKIDRHHYDWYINLRRQKKYQMTSGFGMGIERYIAWALGLNNIRDAIVYPRLKNIKTYP